VRNWKVPLERKNDAVSKAIQPQDDGVNQGQYHLGQMVSAVAPGVGDVPGQKMAELQHSQKFMEEIHAAVVRQTRMITDDLDISWRIRHFTNC
jgi:hypothetical protein